MPASCSVVVGSMGWPTTNVGKPSMVFYVKTNLWAKVAIVSWKDRAEMLNAHRHSFYKNNHSIIITL